MCAATKSFLENIGLIRQGPGKALLQGIPVPKLRYDYTLARTIAVVLNSTDCTTLDAPGGDGTIVGCDYAGIVEEVRPAVKVSWKKGDRIAGFGPGGQSNHP
jgi:NADPH:quinone reductase-like Zn-dependent oxidoreductase